MRKHLFAIVLAILYGTLLVAPLIGHQAYLTGDGAFYLARIQDVLDGHASLGNAYLWEHKEGLPQQLFLAENILAHPLRLFHISVETGYIIYTGLLGALVFFLSYVTFRSVSKSQAVALLGTSVMFVGLFMSRMLRPVSPQFNILFFILELFLLWKAQASGRYQWFILSGLNLGFLFYIYPYYWTAYLILIGLLIVYGFFRDRPFLLRLLLVLGIAFLVALPYGYLTLQSSRLPVYAETLTRVGLIYSRFPSGITTFLWSFVPLLCYLAAIKKKIIPISSETWFWICALITHPIAANQHIITGKNLEFSSHYNMGAIYFSLVALAYLISRSNWALTIRGAVYALASAMIIIGFVGYVRQMKVPAFNEYSSVISWLEKNTAPDSVVLAPEDLSQIIPAYTRNNVFFARNANLFFISDQEVIDRFLINNYFESITAEFVVDNVRSLYGVRYQDIYGHTNQENKLRNLLGLTVRPAVFLPHEAIAFVQERAKFIQSLSFQDALASYRVDYLIWDAEQQPDWPLDTFDFLKLLDAEGRYRIFKVSFGQ